jgi:hypothetical protein
VKIHQIKPKIMHITRTVISKPSMRHLGLLDAGLHLDSHSPANYAHCMAPKVTPVIDAPRVSSANTGAAPAIRRMKMRYPEMSEAQIAKRVGCDPANVHRVLKRFLGDGITEQDHEAFKANTADIFDRLTHKMLMSITDADIAKAQLLPRVTSAAILHDKARTIRGQATQINVSVLLDAVQAIKDMRTRAGNQRAIGE